MIKTIELTLTENLLESIITDLSISNNELKSFIEEYEGLVKKYKNDPNRIETFKSCLKESKQEYKEAKLLIKQLEKHMEKFNA